MGDIKLYSLAAGQATELEGQAMALEKSLQTLLERNLEEMLGVRFVASEYSTGPRHGGRIDTLGLDENGMPVIIEYKRARNENVINQGLFYLDWLMDHQGEFELLVMKTLGRDAAESLDWGGPRLLCIAGDFTRYDEHAVQQMNRSIELLRYRRFGEQLLLLELVNATQGEPTSPSPTPKASSPQYKTVSQVLEETTGPLADLYGELKATLLALGDDIQLKRTKFYVAFKRLRNFACVEMHPSKGSLSVFLKVNPDHVDLQEGFTRDVRNVGHFGTGDLQVTLRSSDDLHRAHELFLQSYEAS